MQSWRRGPLALQYAFQRATHLLIMFHSVVMPHRHESTNDIPYHIHLLQSRFIVPWLFLSGFAPEA